MKGMKKLLSILMVLTLVLSLGASALAVDITISDANDTGSQYGAYRLLDLTTADGTNPNDDDRTETGYSYTVNDRYREVLQQVTEKTTDKDILDYIAALDAEAMRDFADKVYEKIKTWEPDLKWQTEKTFEGAEQGYYLFAEKVEDGSVDGVASLVMVNTAGQQALTVTTKEEKPSSEKKVQDVNDSEATSGTNPTGWQDSADYDVGDHVPFQLKGTLPGDYDTYDSYKIVFHDQESAGLTFDEGTITVSCGETSYTLPYYGITVTAYAADGHTFDIEITDVKTTFPDATNGSEIVVHYSSLLNDDAVIGRPGNPNTMYMEYTNDHYSGGTGKTPDDKVIVFTYDLGVNKVNEDNEALEGAEFALYKIVPAGTAGAVQLATDGKLYTGETGQTLRDGWYVNVPLKGNSAVENESTTFTTEKGIDDGTYLLVETKTPAGYNSIAPKEFEVSAEHDVLSDDPQLNSVTGAGDDATDITFTFTLQKAEGSDAPLGSTDIQNLTGVELPETGGIGTTIFYIAGAILVAGAVILLVTKKRVSGMEK